MMRATSRKRLELLRDALASAEARARQSFEEKGEPFENEQERERAFRAFRGGWLGGEVESAAAVLADVLETEDPRPGRRRSAYVR
jgi:hypothetical protein